MNGDARWVVDFFIGLIPPDTQDPVKMKAWCWRSVVLGTACLAVGLYASNLIPFISPPYAMATTIGDIKRDFQNKITDTNKKLDRVEQQVTVVQEQIKSGQIRQLTNDLIDARRYQCRAIASADKAALPFWNSRIQGLKFEFEQLTQGTSWDDLPCNSF